MAVHMCIGACVGVEGEGRGLKRSVTVVKDGA